MLAFKQQKRGQDRWQWAAKSPIPHRSQPPSRGMPRRGRPPENPEGQPNKSRVATVPEFFTAAVQPLYQMHVDNDMTNRVITFYELVIMYDQMS